MNKINSENILSIIVIGRVYSSKKGWKWSSKYFITTKDGKIIKGITKIYKGYPGYDSYYWTTLKFLDISTDYINGVNGHEIDWHYELIQVRYIEELSV